MLNKNTLDAYHKITAPEGLRERIEARVQAEQTVGEKKNSRKMLWVPVMTAAAAALVCLMVWAGGAGRIGQDHDNGIAMMKLGDQQAEPAYCGIQVMLENGEVLGSGQTEITVHSGDFTDINSLLNSVVYGVAEADLELETTGAADFSAAAAEERATAESGKGNTAEAVVFIVTVPEPVTFKADGEILSKYDADKMLWSEPSNELMLETEGELCVLLTPMGDKEVFYIEMSSASGQSLIEIVYDKKAGQYMAACQNTAGE